LPASKKVLLVVLGIAAVLAAVFALRRAIEPEENKVRRRIESMADGFNSSRAGKVLDGIAESFAEKDAGVEKEELRAFLAYLFFKERDPESKRFRYQVEVSKLEVALDPPGPPEGPPRASVSLEANFLELRAQKFTSVWKASIQGTLEKGDDGWQVIRSSHQTVEGRRPWR
jgi:hypothetical protein